MDILAKVLSDAVLFDGRPIGETLRDAADEIDRLRSLTTWQPIETAPKDGTRILLTTDVDRNHSDPRMWVDAWFDGGANPKRAGWWFHRMSTPTHWMPLPTPPGAGT